MFCTAKQCFIWLWFSRRYPQRARVGDDDLRPHVQWTRWDLVVSRRRGVQRFDGRQALGSQAQLVHKQPVLTTSKAFPLVDDIEVNYVGETKMPTPSVKVYIGLPLKPASRVKDTQLPLALATAQEVDRHSQLRAAASARAIADAADRQRARPTRELYAGACTRR